MFEDKALADDVAAIVEKQIHFGDEDRTQQEAKHLEETTQTEARTVVWFGSFQFVIVASSGNEIQFELSVASGRAQTGISSDGVVLIDFLRRKLGFK